ncbi:hypothetical protein [Actinomyces faecalis]|uniref:VG15 protein n=1 Tax=Actinomyces faecalis TaxID=2722820 RepID=UPI001551F013|nr:hypothetical protein [Actinomyces faecalis]
MSVSTFRAALDAIVRLFRTDAARAAQAVASVSTAGMSEAERYAALDAAGRTYRSYLADAVTVGRCRAWAAALLHLEDQARTQAGASAFLPAEPRYDPSLVRDEIRAAGGPVTAPTTQQRVATALVRHVEMAARQTVVDSVDTGLGREKDDEGQEALTRSERRWLEAQSQAAAEEDAQDSREQAARLAQARQILDDAGIAYDLSTDQAGRTVRRPFAWARVLRPSADKPACGLCIVCAARGPVYSSLEAALTPDGTSLERYHDNCRCVAVPVYTSRSWPGKEDWERLADKYDEVSAWKVTDDSGGKVVEHRLSGAEIRTALDRWSRGDRSEEKSFAREARKIGAYRRLPVRQDIPIDTDGNPVTFPPSEIGEITTDSPGIDHIIQTHGKGAGIPRKTEFKTSNAAAIAQAIHNTVHDSKSTWERYGDKYIVISTHSGYSIQVNIRADLPESPLWTGYPKASGEYPKNPRGGTR